MKRTKPTFSVVINSPPVCTSELVRCITGMSSEQLAKYIMQHGLEAVREKILGSEAVK